MRSLQVVPWCLILLTSNVVLVTGQESCLNGTVEDPDDPLAYVRARFPGIQFQAPTGSPFLGFQNITYCCVKAIDQWLRNSCQNDSEVRISERILENDSQFPCGASWNGDPLGAPEVDVTYNWAKHNCTGWQRSDASKINEWAQLLVAFILPAVVFSFNIPRPGKLKVWKRFFPEEVSNYKVFAGIPGVVGAAISVSIDTIAWLMVSFAFAGPLLLSGLYEAMLDKRVLDCLHRQIKYGKIPMALQARILFTILCGNLDMKSAWCDTMDLVKHLDKIDREWPEFQQTSDPLPRLRISHVKDGQAVSSGGDASPLTRDRSPSPGDLSGSSKQFTGHSRSVSQVTYADTRSSLDGGDISQEPRDTDPLNSQQYLGVLARDYAKSDELSRDELSLYRTRSANSISEIESRQPADDQASTYRGLQYDRFKTAHKVVVRLKAMLACQYSFGSTIGGPVVFFIGSFVYTLLDINQNIGDENIAEALAFGMWWTIIPHVAAVAGLLLAGNNPNILEGIVGLRDYRYPFGEPLMSRELRRQLTFDPDHAAAAAKTKRQKKKWYYNLTENVYDGDADYTPAWMWKRGRSKQDWLIVLFTDSWLKYQRTNGEPPQRIRRVLQNFLGDAVILTLSDWTFLWTFAILLVGIPFLFAFLTAYYTPPIGIACRSVTLVIYMGSQILLSLLWVYYLTFKDKYWATAWNVNRILQGRRTATAENTLYDLIQRLRHQGDKDTTKTVSQSGQGPHRMSLAGIADTLKPSDENHPGLRLLFIVLCTIAFLVSLLTSIGGSLMQIIGVYRNCLCRLPASDWFKRNHDSVFITLSTDTREDIIKAQRNWIILGACNVVFLGGICYFGWWYQKSLRALFKKVAESMEEEEEEQEAGHEEHHHHGRDKDDGYELHDL